MLSPDLDEERDVAATEFSVTTEEEEAADAIDSVECDQGREGDATEHRPCIVKHYFYD